MEWFWIILFLILGLGLVALEVVAIPGTTIVGVAGLLMVGYAIYETFADLGSFAGWCVVGSTLVVFAILLWIFMQSKTWKKASLQTQNTGKVNLIDTEKITVGATGKTISRLAPSGKASIEGQIVEVQSLNELIDEETDIEVIKIDGNKIFVKKLTK